MINEQPKYDDVVRRDFINAYAKEWHTTQAYAADMLEHVEIGAKEDALADFYQQLCHMHTDVLLTHGGQVAQGLALAIREAVKLIPEDKKRAAEQRWAEKNTEES